MKRVREEEDNEDVPEESSQEEDEQTNKVEEEDENDEDGSEGELEVHTAYVEGIPFDVNEDELWNLFSDCGNLVDMRLPKWNDSGRLRGYGHFDFSSEKDLKACIKKMDKYTIGGRYLAVSRAKEQTRQKFKINSNMKPDEIPETFTTIFVKNLPYDTDEDVISEAFARFGKVVNVRLAKWNHTGRLKGFGYVQFAKVQAVRTAMASKDPVMVADRKVIIDVDSEKGRPKSSFRDRDGRQWKKAEGKKIIQRNQGTSRGRGSGRGGFRGGKRGRFNGPN